jgi:hypothetical protein
VAACANGSGDRIPSVISTSAKYHPPWANQVNGLRARAEFVDAMDALSTKDARKRISSSAEGPAGRARAA